MGPKGGCRQHRARQSFAGQTNEQTEAHSENAAVSLYLTLMLAVMIPLILTMIEGARISAIKLRLECAADLMAESLLSEYNRELLKQYDLLLIDTAYDTGSGSLDHMLEHLEEYLSYNLQPSKGIYLFTDRDLLGLTLESAEIVSVSRATDEEGAVFEYLVISAMLEKCLFKSFAHF